jgi:hypothetical protein
MNLLIGTLALSAAVIIFGLTLVTVRNPKSPGWTQGYVAVSTFVMVVISLGSSGLIVASRAFAAGALPGLPELLLSLTAVPVTAAVVWLMRIKQRLAGYAALPSAGRSDAAVVDLPGAPVGPAAPGRDKGGRLAA